MPANYKIVSPVDDTYKENRFLLFNFRPGSPGFIENDEISWDAKPKWNYPQNNSLVMISIIAGKYKGENFPISIVIKYVLHLQK